MNFRVAVKFAEICRIKHHAFVNVLLMLADQRSPFIVHWPRPWPPLDACTGEVLLLNEECFQADTKP